MTDDIDKTIKKCVALMDEAINIIDRVYDMLNKTSNEYKEIIGELRKEIENE